jgi:nucleoside 2-deoxyribosyltransferase
MKRPPLIYLSGPLTTGDTIGNIRRAVELGAALIDVGYAVIIPHEKAFCMEMLRPKTYDEWLEYDFRCIACCDAVFRMPGESRGGDAEVSFAGRNRIPVYYTLLRLLHELPPDEPGPTARESALQVAV